MTLRVTDIESGILRRNFDWPSDTDDEVYQIWRHLTNYKIEDGNGNMIDACMYEHGQYTAKGTLLARPGSMTPSLADVEIQFIKYSIDFGKSAEDGNRGYWVIADEELLVEDDDDNAATAASAGTDSAADGGKPKKKKKKNAVQRLYYKCETPHRDYKKIAAEMEGKVRRYLQLHDVLTRSGSQHVTVNPINQWVICKMSVQDFHKNTHKAFDLDFIRRHALFVLDHLKVRIGPPGRAVSGPVGPHIQAH